MWKKAERCKEAKPFSIAPGYGAMLNTFQNLKQIKKQKKTKKLLVANFVLVKFTTVRNINKKKLGRSRE